MPRIRLEPFTIALVCAVILASILPAHGRFAEIFSLVTKLAIALLFFMHGAKLAFRTVLDGIMHWRLQLTIFATTYLVFPLIGILAMHPLERILPHDLVLGIVYVCLLPSTVQSSIAFTSIARGQRARSDLRCLSFEHSGCLPDSCAGGLCAFGFWQERV